MNWTGGSLQRTKQAKKGVVQKQKAYFAQTRSRLQNGRNMPAVPFRPDYFQKNDDSELSGRPPLYGISSVRHAGRSARLLHEGTRRGNLLHSSALETGDMRPRSRKGATPELSRGGASVMGHVKRDVAEFQSSKRKVDDTDIETRLLEANKKRLLSQRDWIGVATSQPMHLNFLNDEEKSKIGRRRKVRGSHGATARQVQPMGKQYTRAITSNVSKNQPNEICIRIGTDALTTAYSTDHNDYDQSQASSDSMLFDQQTHAIEHTAFQDVAQPTARGGTSPLGYTDTPRDRKLRPDFNGIEALIHCRTHSLAPLKAEDHQERTPTRDQRKQQEHIGSTKRSQYKNIPHSEQTVSDFQMIQSVQGIRQPLRLVFALTSPSTDSHAPNAFHSFGQSDTNHASEEDHAGSASTGDMHELDNEPERRSESEAAGAIAIVDGKPWNSFFNVPGDNSSHRGTSNNSEKSLVHAHAILRTREAERHSWSQHATQGDEIHISSSLISASSPSLQRATQTRGLKHDREVSMELRSTTLIAMDEDERLWRDFVFEVDEPLSCATMSERRGESDRKCSSAYLPLSVAVSSTNFTPFRPTPGRHFRMGGGGHDAAMLAPPSGSSAFPSLAAAASFVEEVSDEELDAVDTGEGSAFGEHFVTHTSLLNNASGESLFQFPGTETSRSGLEHYYHNREGLLAGPGPRRALTQGVLDSEDDGIDLVDPDKLSSMRCLSSS